MSRPSPFSAGAGPLGRFRMAATLLAVLAPLPALGQSPGERVRAFGETAGDLTLVGSVERGVLLEGQERLLPLELEEDNSYLIAAFCDADCTDLDLALLDPAGEEVGSDLLPDAEPIISFTAEAGGLFQLRVGMVACGVGPCAYAVGIFAGTTRGGFSAASDMDATLDTFREEMEAEGFGEFEEMEHGALDESQEFRFSVPLQGGVEYRILGVCDQDCDDLDLRLFDPEGREVSSDLLGDAIPVLEVTPDSTAEYRVAVIMVSCDIEPCAFQIAGVARGEGLGPGGVAITGTVVLDVTHEGTLEITDQTLREGEHFDEYQIEAQEGQRIIVDFRSPDFDTYLILEAPGGESERNDDFDDDMQHSHVEMVAPETGTYSILATSFSAGATGRYALRVVVTEGS